MLSKNQISLVNSLQRKKFRREEGLFIAEGEKSVRDLLHSRWQLVTLFGTQSYFQNLGDVRIPKATEVVLVTDEELKKISALTTPQRVLAVVRIPEVVESVYDSGLILALDNINDPGNLGTIIRIADWFGIKKIICSKETVDCYNPKVVQGSMGSLFRIRVDYRDLAGVFEENLRKTALPVFGMVLDGESIYNMDYPADAFILMGSESTGIQPALSTFITNKITIPAIDSGADSLNVAIATGIICYEFRRK